MKSIIKNAIETTVSIMKESGDPVVRLQAARIIFENAAKVKEIIRDEDFEALFK